MAVTEEQILEWNLPTRPTKTSDTRSRGFKGRSVEVDAIPVETLRELARDAIEEHLDKHTLEMTRKIEEAERWEFMQFAAAMQGKSKKGPDDS
ncbi:MAG: hypothetical protein JRN52_06545 [Nitrososphaerota archaeon]|nr:hypothetical protein [Nitrososphaerota archaeon]